MTPNRVRVAITPKNEWAETINPSYGEIVGYIAKGDYYTSEILTALELNPTPVQSNHDVFIVRRDNGSYLLVPRSVASEMMVVEEITDLNVIQNEIIQRSYFINDKALKKKKGFWGRLFWWVK